MGEKVTASFEIGPNDETLLQQAVEKYNLPDKSKALRCLFGYLEEDADWDDVFSVVRCRNC